MIFDLVKDFADVLDAMQDEHPRRRILKLLDEAIRRDVHFIDRHPTTLFQCLWNTCWWYDCPEAAMHYDPPQGGWSQDVPPWEGDGEKLCDLLADWLGKKQADTPAFPWLRSLRPPPVSLLGLSIRMIRSTEAPLVCSAFSPDGRQIAIGSSDGKVRIWDANTGEELLHLHKVISGIRHIAYSSEGDRIVGASHRTVSIWNALTGHLLAEYSGHKGEITSVMFSPNGRELLTTSKDKTGRRWNAQSGVELLRIGDPHEGYYDTTPILMARFSPDGERALVSYQDGTARLLCAVSGAEIALLQGHQEPIEDVAFAAESDLVATAARDKSVLVWDASTGQALYEVPALGMAFSPDGSRFATTSREHVLEIREARIGRILTSGSEESADRVEYSPDGRRIVTMAPWSADTITVWDADTGQKLNALRATADGGIQSVVFSPSDSRMSLCHSYMVLIWDSDAGGGLSRQPRGHRENISCIAFTPDGERLATGAFDRTVRIWEARTGLELMCLKHGTGIHSIAFSHSGRVLAFTLWDSTARLCDAETGHERLTLRGHYNTIDTLVFSPDDRQVATVSWDGTARIWSCETGEEQFVIEGDSQRSTAPGDEMDVIHRKYNVAVELNPRPRVTQVAFTPDGERIVCRFGNDKLGLWDAHSGKLLNEAVESASRSEFSDTASESIRRAPGQGNETVIAGQGDAILARFPAGLQYIASSGGRRWAGALGHNLCLIQLEGALEE